MWCARCWPGVSQSSAIPTERLPACSWIEPNTAALPPSTRSRAAGDTMPAYIVEKHLHCDASTVPGLLQMGLLEGHRSPTGLRITSGSVEAFKTKYLSLASIANSIGTSSRGLMHLCGENGIKLLLVPRTGEGAQPFIRLSDRPKLSKPERSGRKRLEEIE